MKRDGKSQEFWFRSLCRMNMWQRVEMRIRFINLHVMLQLNGEVDLYM